MFPMPSLVGSDPAEAAVAPASEFGVLHDDVEVDLVDGVCETSIGCDDEDFQAVLNTRADGRRRFDEDEEEEDFEFDDFEEEDDSDVGDDDEEYDEDFLDDDEEEEFDDDFEVDDE